MTLTLKRRIERFAVIALLFSVLGCSETVGESRYQLAEKFYDEGKFDAAVTEWEHLSRREEVPDLVARSLFRAAEASDVGLNQPQRAAELLQKMIYRFPNHPWNNRGMWLLGNLYFEKLERYDLALAHYRRMSEQGQFSDKIEVVYERIARSAALLYRFEEAIVACRTLEGLARNTAWKERATAARAAVLLTAAQSTERNDRDAAPAKFELAKQAYLELQKNFPGKEKDPVVIYELATIDESLGRLEEALTLYKSIVDRYPSPAVVKLKLKKVEQRLLQRKMD